MKVQFEVTKWTVIKGIVFCALLLGAVFFGAFMTVPTAYDKGKKDGYLQALSDVAEQTGIAFDWKQLPDGSYQINAYYMGSLVARGYARADVYVWHYRNGKLLTYSSGAGVLTDYGKAWLKQKIGNHGYANNTSYGTYISTSDDSSAPNSGWGQIPSEITGNGLARANGTYTSTGTGSWNISYTFSVSGTQDVRLYGQNWASGNTWGNLIASDNSTVKSCINGDTLKVTWQDSVA